MSFLESLVAGITTAVLAAALLCPGAARAESLAVCAHLGGVSASESLADLGDLDWKTGVADLALEAPVFGPLSLGIGGEVLLETDRLAIVSKEAGFAYAKLRLPLPLSPYAGLGFELRRAETFAENGTAEHDWHRGNLFLAGVGFRLSRISLDLEFRASRTEIDDTVLRLYSLRPGIGLWF